MTKELTVDGLRVTLERKAVRNINMRLRPDGTVYISLPRMMPEAEAIAFMRSKRAWIDAHQARQAGPAEHKPSPPVTEGMRLPFWSGELTVHLAPGPGRSAASRSGESLVLSGAAAQTEAGCHALLRRFYADALIEALQRLIPKAEAAVGRHAVQWRVKYMKSRYGSCNSHTAVIAINAGLAGYGEEALYMVMIHELTHLIHPNHGPGFYAAMDAACPRWREADGLLKADPGRLALLLKLTGPAE